MKQKLQNLLHRVRSHKRPFDQATPEDVYYAYRLLLNREPDEAGLAYWLELINVFQVPLSMIVEGFLNSPEFAMLREERQMPQLVTLPEFKLYVQPMDFFIGATIIREGTYEPYVTAQIKRLLKAGDTFLDIGANIGYFSMLSASIVGQTGQVLAFEPNPNNCNLLRQSATANGFNNIQLHQNAVAEKEMTILFTAGGADSNGRLINPDEPIAQDKGLPSVQAVALDKVLANVDKIDLVKMDIEGAEGRALMGMISLIERHLPPIVFEFNPDLIRTTSQMEAEVMLAMLAPHYEFWVIQRAGGLSERPLTIPQLQQYHQKELTHLDILAMPKS